MLETISILALVVGALSLILHFLPKSSDKTVAKAQADVDSVWDWIAAHLASHSASAAQPPANISHTTTVNIPNSAPAGTPLLAPTATVPPVPLLTPITGAAAWDRYQKAGGYTAWKVQPFFQGLLNLYEMNWLKSLARADLSAWIADFAAAGPAPDPASDNVVAGVHMTKEAATYLVSLQQDYAIPFDAP